MRINFTLNGVARSMSTEEVESALRVGNPSGPLTTRSRLRVFGIPRSRRS